MGFSSCLCQPGVEGNNLGSSPELQQTSCSPCYCYWCAVPETVEGSEAYMSRAQIPTTHLEECMFSRMQYSSYPRPSIHTKYELHMVNCKMFVHKTVLTAVSLPCLILFLCLGGIMRVQQWFAVVPFQKLHVCIEGWFDANSAYFRVTSLLLTYGCR